MSVWRNSFVLFMLRYVLDFPRRPQYLYWSKTALAYYTDEGEPQSFSSYYGSLGFDSPRHP